MTTPQQSKSAAREREYRRFRLAYLDDHPVCECCDTALATMVHHRRRLGRGGAKSLELNVLAVCAPCHDGPIHGQPESARLRGWLIFEGDPDWDACAQTRKESA